jgi:hypothetical protein
MRRSDLVLNNDEAFMITMYMWHLQEQSVSQDPDLRRYIVSLHRLAPVARLLTYQVESAPGYCGDGSGEYGNPIL